MEMRSGQSEQNDSRLTERIPFRLPVRATIYPTYEGSGEPAKTCHVLANDLSGGGISLICGRRVREGQRIKLEMPDRDRHVIACRISQTDGGQYLIGCRFDDAAS